MLTQLIYCEFVNKGFEQKKKIIKNKLSNLFLYIYIYILSGKKSKMSQYFKLKEG